MSDSILRSRPVKLVQIALQFVRAGFLVRTRFRRLERAQKLQEIQHWASQVLRVLDIEVETNQAPPQGFAGLVVSNHLSWVDILVLQSILPGTFVAKSEVQRWPVVGYLAQACATIFVERTSARSAHAMVDHTVSAIRAGCAVFVFPEGTSTNGADLGVFHPNIFESAVRAASPVQLLTLRYLDKASGEAASAVHFTGDTSLLESLSAITQLPTTRAVVHVGECLTPAGHTRRTLAAQAHQKIRAKVLASSAMRLAT